MTRLTLNMPRLGETMDEGIIANWLVRPGEKFQRGTPLVEIETDKTLVEFPALGDGEMLEYLVVPGDSVLVNAPIARIAAVEDKDWAEMSAGDDRPAEDVPERKAPAELAAAPAVTAGAAEPDGASGKRRATPLARRLAEASGLELSTIVGTGRRGRIERRDVELRLHGSAASRILLIHGFAGDGRSWNGLAAMLRSHGAEVDAPDLPGHGENTAEATDVNDLVAFLERKLGSMAGQVHLVGHSLGGAVAAILAHRHSERVASLTLIAPAGLGSEIEGRFVRGMAHASTADEVVHLLAYLGQKGRAMSDLALTDMANALAAGRLRQLAEAIAGENGQKIAILRQLQDLSARLPVRVIFGLNDQVIPPQHATRVPMQVAVHYLADAGHMPQWDAPEAIATLLSREIAADV